MLYMYRDTTVQSLTLQASVRDGVVVYEDSPLVQAVRSGHVLVVDEADKAPTHVTCILKVLTIQVYKLFTTLVKVPNRLCVAYAFSSRSALG